MKILLVDDNADDRFWLSRMLRELLEDLVVTECSSAEQASEVIDEQTFDLVILDNRLPGASGVELLGQLRKYNDWTPVVVTSSYNDLQSVRESLVAGLASYVSKDQLNRDRLAESIAWAQTPPVKTVSPPPDLLIESGRTAVVGSLKSGFERISADIELVRKRPRPVLTEQDIESIDALETLLLRRQKELDSIVDEYQATLASSAI